MRKSYLCLLLLLLNAPFSLAEITGCYETPNGELFTVFPSGSEKNTYRVWNITNGLISRLTPGKNDAYFWKDDNSHRSSKMLIDVSTIRRDGELIAMKLPLNVERVEFDSEGTKLRGIFVFPQGDGPFPLITYAHGSGKSSIFNSGNPYSFPAFGIATFFFDKRGVGSSAGRYTQNFEILIQGQLNAIDFARAHRKVDPDQIAILGVSLGGWIAPLSAEHRSDIKALLIRVGPTVSTLENDRWQALSPLYEKGYDVDAIAQATEVVDAAHFIARSNLKDGWSEFKTLKRKYRKSTWVKDIAGMPEAFLEHSKLGVKAYFWWSGGFSDPDWDPMTLLRTLDIPIRWTFGGNDKQVPTARSVELLNHEIQHNNKPWEIHLLPEADHNLVAYKELDGRKVLSHFSQAFLLDEALWLKQIFEESKTADVH